MSMWFTLTRILVQGGLLMLLIMPLAPATQAFSWEALFSPGALSQPHQKLDEKCADCHGEQDKKTTTPQCLACHKKVATDVRNKTGYHGRAPGIATGDCKACHTEHKGRDHRLLDWNPATFNHSQTDFRLTGAHSDATCGGCHKQDKLWREAPHACVSCHEDQDVHDGKQGKKCESCHNARGWSRNVRFDHDKTRFHLKGAHKTAACGACHTDKRYAQTPRECAACHRKDDRHTGILGTRCDSCHNTQKWSQTRFDHTRDGHFRLEGVHQNVACKTCHTRPTSAKPLPKTCIGCHQSDDIHAGANGTRCDTCHDTRKWSQAKFDHSQTRFRLTGAHKDVRCEACHAGDVHAPLGGGACALCHGKADPHQGRLGQDCKQCHSTRNWRSGIRFDHALTGFPLLGLHELADCQACHADSTFTRTPDTCKDCHGKKDPHKGSMGEACEGCHTPADWTFWRFDHDQTDFPLTGAHAQKVCDSCHTPGTPASETPVLCGACHEQDDVHRGEFGQTCDTCHSTRQFTDVEMRR
ncbi:MAG: hypothetical protein D6758_12345 [Gammaproteobacteria bacterium]|nr:MAG: hypothetical protein D6758_12345 [Gammaproteobacteria bacterium]